MIKVNFRKDMPFIFSLLLCILFFLFGICKINVFAEEKVPTSIEYSPGMESIELIENVDGEYQEEDGYFRYYIDLNREGASLTVHYDDDTSDVYECKEVYNEEGGYNELKFMLGDQELTNGLWYSDDQYELHWNIGEHEVKVCSLDLSAPLKVKVVKNPVAEIDYQLAEPIEIPADNNEYGNYDESNNYFHYHNSIIFQEGAKLTVKYSDGRDNETYTYEEIPVEGEDWFEYKFMCGDKELPGNYSWIDDQDLDNPWEPGEHFVTLKYYGQICKVPVKILSNPVKSITYEVPEPIQYIEGVGGAGHYDEDTDEYLYDKNLYNIDLYQIGSKLTVKYSDGRDDETYIYQSIPVEGAGWSEWKFMCGDKELSTFFGELSYSDDQTKDAPWGVGDHYVTVSYSGQTCEVPVKILPNPVESISFQPANGAIKLIADVGGEFDTDVDGIGYFRYYTPDVCQEGSTITVYYTDKTHKDYTYQIDEENEEWVFASGDDILNSWGDSGVKYYDKQEHEHWKTGSDNIMFVTYMGRECPIYVTIEETAVKEISYKTQKPIELIEDVDFWKEDGEIIFSNSKILQDGAELTVTYKDDQPVNYIYDKDKDYFISGTDKIYSDDVILYAKLTEDSTWTLGTDNLLTISYQGVETNIHVSIIDNPVSSIEFKPSEPITLRENIDFVWFDEFGERYIDELNVDLKSGDQLIVTYEENTKTFIYNSDTETFVFEDQEINKDEIGYYSDGNWSVGDTNSMIIEYSGRNTIVNVIIQPYEENDPDADQVAADEVAKLIENIPDDENAADYAEKVKAAQVAYDELSQAAKEKLNSSDSTLESKLTGAIKKVEEAEKTATATTAAPKPTTTAAPKPVTTAAPAPTTTPAPAAPVASVVGSIVKVGGQKYKVTSASTVTFAKAKKGKKATVPATIKINGKVYKVSGIAKSAFKGTKIQTVVIKSQFLTKKSVKGSLKGSQIKTISVKVGKKKVNKTFVKKYKKIFTKKIAGKKVTVK